MQTPNSCAYVALIPEDTGNDSSRLRGDDHVAVTVNERRRLESLQMQC